MKYISNSPAVPDSDTARTLNHLKVLAQNGFWGAVKIKFEAGRAVHILQEESLIPSRITDNPRNFDASHTE